MIHKMTESISSSDFGSQQFTETGEIDPENLTPRERKSFSQVEFKAI